MISNTSQCGTVLVVEDDDDIRESLKDGLENEGFAVDVARNGKEALNLLRSKESPCLVLLDMMMPVMDGRGFLDEILKDTTLSKIPICVVSATATRLDITGAIGFLKKPVDLDVV